MNHVPEGVATTDGRNPDTANPGRCAAESLAARIDMQHARHARDLRAALDAYARVQEWATTNQRGH